MIAPAPTTQPGPGGDEEEVGQALVPLRGRGVDALELRFGEGVHVDGRRGTALSVMYDFGELRRKRVGVMRGQ